MPFVPHLYPSEQVSIADDGSQFLCKLPITISGNIESFVVEPSSNPVTLSHVSIIVAHAFFATLLTAAFEAWVSS